MKKPLVSIGMPVYNGQDFLEEALKSLLAQDYENFELIISDNASTDRTGEICMTFASDDKRISYYRQNQNIGDFRNFDFVSSLARGPYFMWAADDDVWDPSYISVLVDFLENKPEYVIAYSRCDEIDKYDRSIGEFQEIYQISLFRNIFSRLKRYLLMEGKVGKAVVVYGLIRTHVLKLSGGFGCPCKSGVSWDNLTVFCLLTFGPFAMVDKLMFHKRRLKPKRKRMARLLKNMNASVRKHRYSNGYRNIIKHSPFLSKAQKTGLVFIACLVEFKDHVKCWRI